MFGLNNTGWFVSLFWRREELQVSEIVMKTNSENPFDFNWLEKKQIFGMQETKCRAKNDILIFTLFD